MKPFKLDEHQKITSGFKTPEGYFDSFPEQMMQRLHSETRQETKVIPLHRNRNRWIFAAAAVFVLSLSIPIINQLTKNTQPDHSEIDNYLAYQDISEDYIVSLLEPEDIQNIAIDYKLEDKTIEEALPSDIENYILD